MTLALALAIVILSYWRFKDVPLDRDWTPYAYPAINRTPWLTAGHQDIKPPLIHWSYKLWAIVTSTPSTETLRAWVRALPVIANLCSVTLLESYTSGAGLLLALLVSLPTMWTHMANTEWLTVFLLSVAVGTSATLPPIAWLALGLLPWANQKNVLLIAPVAWALHLYPTGIGTIALLVAPSLFLLLYLALTGRMGKFITWCWTIPAQFGKKRTLRANTLGHLHLLKPGLFLMLPLVATMNTTWGLVLLAMVAVAISSKQVMPHHFLLLALPIALGASISTASLLAFGLAWILIDLPCWLRPSLVYPLTFADKSGAHYGMVLGEGEWVAQWMRLNAPEEDTIWVNGIENNVYLQCGLKAWAIIIPELTVTPEGTPPRHIIHCRGNVPYDYDANGYEMADASPLGGLVIMRRKN